MIRAAGVTALLLLVLAAAPVRQHGAQILAVMRDAGAVLLTAAAVAVAVLTARAVSAPRPGRCRPEEYEEGPAAWMLPGSGRELPEPVHAVAAVVPAPPVPLPGRAPVLAPAPVQQDEGVLR